MAAPIRTPSASLSSSTRLAQLVAVAVQVVELAHCGDAGLEHLAENQTRMIEVVGGLPLGEAIHAIAPLPEVARPGLDLAPKKALKRMTVHIRQPGNCPSLEHDRGRRRKRVVLDCLDASVFDLDQDVLGTTAEPRLLGVPRARSVQSLRMGRRTPRSRATSTARS